MHKDTDCTGQIEAETGATSGMCRFLKNPYPDCYCLNITGRTISKIVAFCANDYRNCSIYRAKTDPGRYGK